MPKPKVVVFWTDANTHSWLQSELFAGRLRQGWAIPNTPLMESGSPVPYAQWSEQFALSAKRAWDWDPSEKAMKTRFGILSRMLTFRQGDLIVVPRMPAVGQFTIAQVTEGYEWNDEHFHSPLPGTLPYFDFAHVVKVDPTRLVTHAYDSSPEAGSVAENFRNYRSAVNNVNNEQYADAIREIFDRSQERNHMLNVAIVGLGGIGNTHGGVYEKNPDAKIVAVCDIIADKADKAAARYGCPAFYSVQGMLGSGIQIDAASVCSAGTENGGDHYQPTMELLAAGIPVLGEKPISNDVSKAAEIVALAREKNLRYGINLNHRFTPAALRAKEWITEGRLGEVNIVNMIMWINNPNESSPWFHIRALHPHSLDVMRFFCGDVDKVQAFFKRGPRADGPDGRRVCWSNVQANLLFKNGTIGHLTGSYDAGGSYGLETLEVVGSEGRIVLLDACEHLTFYPRHSRQTETYDYLGGMMNFSETFGQRIGKWVTQNLSGDAPEAVDASGADALHVQRIIEAIIESWETGTVVTL